MDPEELDRAARLAAADQEAMLIREVRQETDAVASLAARATVWDQREQALATSVRRAVPALVGAALSICGFATVGLMSRIGFALIFALAFIICALHLGQMVCFARKRRLLNEAGPRLEILRARMKIQDEEQP